MVQEPETGAVGTWVHAEGVVGRRMLLRSVLRMVSKKGSGKGSGKGFSEGFLEEGLLLAMGFATK